MSTPQKSQTTEQLVFKAFADKTVSQREILETITLIKGERYKRFIVHSFTVANLNTFIEPQLKLVFTMFATNILHDLAESYGINLKDPVASAGMIKDLESLGLVLGP